MGVAWETGSPCPRVAGPTPSAGWCGFSRWSRTYSNQENNTCLHPRGTVTSHEESTPVAAAAAVAFHIEGGRPHKGRYCFLLTSLGLSGRRLGSGVALPTCGGADLSTKRWHCGCVSADYVMIKPRKITRTRCLQQFSALEDAGFFPIPQSDHQLVRCGIFPPISLNVLNILQKRHQTRHAPVFVQLFPQQFGRHLCTYDIQSSTG